MDRLDVLTVGRIGVDLYGEQWGGRLEDVASFAKYLGGCPANIAVGCARLGLRSGLVSAVGDEPMGHFLREELIRNGVDVRGLQVDPERPTALVILGIRDRDTFPLVFFRENCADGALTAERLDPALLGATRCLVVTGTHFSRPHLAAMQERAMALARTGGARLAFDIDYRPVLWGLTPRALGEIRYVPSAEVTARLQAVVRQVDLVVGTEEEFRIAGGSEDVMESLRRLRTCAPQALFVLKLGARGAAAFPGAIPERPEDGIYHPGFPIEVYNVLGAGDAFMAGFLSGWLRDLPLQECLRRANACGAIVVSRHGCAPAMPTAPELDFFLERGVRVRALRHDAELEHLHRVTTRRGHWARLFALAFDHRSQFQELAAASDRGPEAIAAFKRLVYRALLEVAERREDVGLLVDDRFGEDILADAAARPLWVGRPVEEPGSLPLRFAIGRDLGSQLRRWPVTQCVKCLVLYHPDDPEPLRRSQEEALLTLQEACFATDHELLLEVVASRSNLPVETDTLARALAQLYDCGLRPDWWKLPDPGSDEGWDAVAAVVKARDPWCRGVLLLGLDAPLAEAEAAVVRAARHPLVKGFAIGRTIWGEAARGWFAGTMGDEEVVALVAGRYRRLMAAFERARGGGP